MILRLSILALCLTLFATSCKKDDDDTSPEPTPGLEVPSTYSFNDANGNNTVSFNGQAQRLEMLSEIASYMKTANTSGVAIDAQQLKDMYANNAYTWDNDTLGMTGSTKQLKNKTAAAGSGIADPGVQASFESYMDEIANISSMTTSGNDNGSAGQGGVVVSTSNPSKQYLQSGTGQEYAQLIEKGLMGAVLYNQICVNYLGEAEMASDNITAVDPIDNKYYTEMEHSWDEAYGYFTSAKDFPTTGTNRFWGKYADGREELLGSATEIATAFRTGRAAISANDLSARDTQISIIRSELADVVAGTAIHYLNTAVANFSDDALRNHQLSEAIAFMSCIPYGYDPIADQSGVMQWFVTLGTDNYAVTTAQILAVRDAIASDAGMEDIKTEL
jgi:hypothetical protein